MTSPNGIIGLPQLPFGVPNIGTSLIGNPLMGLPVNSDPGQPPPGMQRALSFAADHQGCGFWRIHWAESLINAQQLGIVSNNNFMILQENFYNQVKSIRIQRQVTPIQLQFVRFLRDLSNRTNNFKIYYEIDDVIYLDDIPLYNAAREGFTDPILSQNATEIMKMCDAITTPTTWMSDYYQSKTGVKAITLPNYMPKFWMDRFYDKNRIVTNYDRNRKRPRVGYVGSPTHFNVKQVPGAKDDFADINNVIIKTIKDFQWVLFGGCSAELAPYVSAGQIEYKPWAKIYDYPTIYNNLNLNVVIAPLQNNAFNLAKANIKYIEAGALGLPCVCQDLEPYKQAPLRFNTADEMVNRIKSLMSDRKTYFKESDDARKVACNYWLEDHINEHCKLYFS